MCGFGEPSFGAGLGINNNVNGAFGSTNAGVNSSNTTDTNGGLFGQARTTNTQSGGLFGNGTLQSGGLFGSGQHSQTPTGSFGHPILQQQQSGGLFGQTQNRSGGVFGTAHTNTGGSLFGNNVNNNQQQSGGLFGNSRQTNNAGLLGGQPTTSQGSGLFGHPNSQTHNSAWCGGFGTQTSTGNTTTDASLFDGPFNVPKPAPGGLFGGNTSGGSLFGSSSNQRGAFGNNNANGGLFGCQRPAATSTVVPLNSNLSGLPYGTATKQVQDFAEKETNGSTSCYKHLCFMPVYSTFSAEELRIADYSGGRRYGSVPTDGTCLALPETVPAPFGIQATSMVDSKLHGFTIDSRDVQIASRDNEIRLLKAKIIILEDQLQRANDKPRFGKLGLDRPSTWSTGSEQAGPLKGDPSIPINPDPRTNNSSFDFRRPTLFAQPESSPKSELKDVPPTKCAAGPSVAGPSTKDNTSLDEIVSLSRVFKAIANTATTPDTTDFKAQLESQSKRMESLESQLTKVTALLEKQSLSTSSAATTVEEQVAVEPKGKEREHEEVQTVTGQSTPAVLVYTPESSPEREEPWNFYDGERIDLTERTCDIKQEVTNKLVDVGLTQTASAVDAAQNLDTKNSFIRASRILELLKVCGRPLSAVEIAAPMGLNIDEANDSLEELLGAKVISVSDGKFSYISPENLR